LSITTSEANRAARDVAKNYYIHCLACKVKVPFYEWDKHRATQDHMLNELAMQEDALNKKDAKWVERYWLLDGESTRWCPTCDQNVKNKDWFAHPEGHRIRKRRPRF
jgi:hypothetical protein